MLTGAGLGPDLMRATVTVPLPGTRWLFCVVEPACQIEHVDGPMKIGS